MHSSSMENMKYFIRKYLKVGGAKPSVLDIGSQEVAGQENRPISGYFLMALVIQAVI